MGNLVVEHLVVGPLQSNCYIVGDEVSREAVIIDPGEDGDMILAAVKRRSWTVKAILNTHAHFDHTGANAAVVKGTGAPLIVPRADATSIEHAHMAGRLYGLVVAASPPPDQLVEGGDVLTIGDEEIHILATPGHTLGCVTFVTSVGVFPGDSLFAGSIGRTDLPGGDYNTLIRSIKEQILVLPDETPVYPGHGPFTTVGREKTLNPFLTDH